MANEPIVTSLLDNDLYKITMQQAILHRAPGTVARYAFQCRNKPLFPLGEIAKEVNEQLDALCALRYTPEELDYLRGLYFIKSDFVDFLEGFQLRRRFIDAKAVGDDLVIETPEAPMLYGMQFEMFVLEIVSETYFRELAKRGLLDPDAAIEEGKRRMKAKMRDLVGHFDLPANRGVFPFEFFDFGTRRRFSKGWQETVVTALADTVPEFFRGTSNMDLARRHNLVPIGTQAHEYLQAFQAMGVRLRDFQKAALESWVQEYRGDLGIALTDVVGSDAFFRDFDRYFAKLFDGLRHDSGDPFAWGEKAISHYQKLGISTADKRLVFSDSLDIKLAINLYERFANRIKVGFGIGTNLTNDLGVTPLNIVMKMVECNGQPVAKLSDTAGKTMCRDENFLRYLRQVFEVKG